MESVVPAPWAHQVKARALAKDLPYFALFFLMGCGKSRTVIDILRDKINENKRLLRTIVIAPPITLPNFKNEIGMFSKIPLERVFVLNQDGKKRLETFQKESKEPAIFITNYEALLMPDLFAAFQRWKPEALIFDESHKLKNYKAKRSKLAERLANPVGSPKPFCYILSGSPVLNSPMDLFQQFLILDGGATFGRNFFVFRARFFVDKNAGMPKERYFPNWVVAPGAVEQINQLIFRVGMRVTKEECLDLPDEVSVTIPCVMTAPQAKNYQEMKRDLVTYVEENSATATLAIVKALRLMQITSGYLPLNPTGNEDDAAKVVYPETPKEAALKELLEELTPHSKVVVWCVWRENYAVVRRVCGELGIELVEVHGEISRAAQDEAVKRFSLDSRVRVFLGHPGSGGIGISLIAAHYDIYFSRTFSLEHYLQARARIHRGGQTHKVTHFDLVVENTIDALVQNALVQKLKMSESLLDTKIAQDIISELTHGG